MTVESDRAMTRGRKPLADGASRTPKTEDRYQSFLESFTWYLHTDKSDSFASMVKCMQVYECSLGPFAVNLVSFASATIGYIEKIHMRQ